MATFARGGATWHLPARLLHRCNSATAASDPSLPVPSTPTISSRIWPLPSSEERPPTWPGRPSPRCPYPSRDTRGRVDITNNYVTLVLAKANGYTVTAQAIGGVATFNNLLLTQAGSNAFKATNGALTGTTSRSFTITPDV